MYGFEVDTRFSISGNRSLDISTEAMFPRVQRASPTTYWLECDRSLVSHVNNLRDPGFRDVLLEGIGDECKDFLVLIQQQTGGEVTEALVGKAGGSQQFEAFYLTKVCAFAESK